MLNGKAGDDGNRKQAGARKCEDCGLKAPSFGLDSDGLRWWCSGCAKGQAGVTSRMSITACKAVNYRVQAGAVNLTIQKCEGCRLKAASFGLPGEGKKMRWCSDCAKGQAGAVGRHSRPPMAARRSKKVKKGG